MSHNKPYAKTTDSQIGDGPSKPVILTRTKAGAIAHVKKRAERPNGRDAPVHRYIDTAKNCIAIFHARSDLLTCGDQRFMELLFDCVSNQAKSLERGDWQLPCCVTEFALVVIGGSMQSFVAVGIGGKRTVRHLIMSEVLKASTVLQ
mmetsp:Transcript_13871/g.29599  ORF Transcript_13871/g.29599 Transcript_13871/m.29599 type:complete len:147 (+) Transcript_13871:294-734(+)